MKTLLVLLLSCLTGWCASTVNITNVPTAGRATTNDLVLGLTNATPAIGASKTRLLSVGDIVGLTPTNYLELDVGDLVVTNTITSAGERVTMARSNIWYDTGTSNIVVNFNCGRLIVNLTNGCGLTNFSGLEAGLGTVTRYMHMTLVGCSNTACVVTYPIGTQFSVRMWTNDAKPLFISITNGVRYDLWWAADGTNLTVNNAAHF